MPFCDEHIAIFSLRGRSICQNYIILIFCLTPLSFWFPFIIYLLCFRFCFVLFLFWWCTCVLLFTRILIIHLVATHTKKKPVDWIWLRNRFRLWTMSVPSIYCVMATWIRHFFEKWLSSISAILDVVRFNRGWTSMFLVFVFVHFIRSFTCGAIDSIAVLYIEIVTFPHHSGVAKNYWNRPEISNSPNIFHL